MARLSWGLGYAHYSDNIVEDDGFGYPVILKN
jgi:hypothetical protein